MAIAGYLPPIIAEVLAETGKFHAEMNGVSTKLGGLESGFGKLAAAGKVAMGALVIAAVGVGYESVKMAMSFDQTMELVHTQAGASQAEVDALKDSVLALAPSVGIGPEKLAEGLYHIESTGMRGKAALDTLEQAAKLAAIGMADLDDVTYAMSGVMSVGLKDVNNAADAIAFMNATVGMGDMRMDKLTQAIGTGILPAFKSAGLGMVDFSAALATLADNSVPADEAATRLKMTVALMSAPTAAAGAALHEIGMTSTQLANDMRQPNGLLVAVMDLKTHLEKSGKTAVEQNQIIEHAFGGGRTSGAIMTLLEESDRLKSKYEQLGTSAGRAAVTNEAWAKQQQQFSQQVHELVSQLQTWGIKIGNFLIPKIEHLVGWISKHKDQVKILAIAVGSVLVVALAAYTVAMIKAAGATIAANWEILLIIAAVAAIAVGIYELVKHWDQAWGWIKRIAGDAWHWIYQEVWQPLVRAYHWVKDELDILEGYWQTGWARMGKALQWIYDHSIGPIIHAIKSAIDGAKSALDTLSGATEQPKFKKDVGKPIGSFDSGGTVPGPKGRPMLAIVHGGEEVLSNDQIAAMGRSPATSRGALRGGSSGSGSGGDVVVQARFVMPDGRQIRTETLRYARRAGIAPSELYPASVRSI